VRDREGERAIHRAEIGRGVDCVNARERARCGGVDRDDARVRDGAAKNGAMEHPGNVNVVHEAAAPA
jgi:hypothetical protein